MALVVFRPFDFYSVRGLGLRVDVDEHFNWGRVMAVPRAGYGDRGEVPELDRLVREVATWTGLRVCQTPAGVEWTPLQLEGNLSAVRAFRDTDWGGLYLVGQIVPGLKALVDPPRG